MGKKELAMKEFRISELRALENNDEDKMIIEGYAAVFETETDLGWCKEIISRDAFNNCNMSDCVLKYNHNDSCLILARTRNKSLELTVDSKGLKIRAILIDTTQNRDIYKMIRAGLLDKMSFAFAVKKQEWDYENDIRRITEISQLFDVSVVDVPAYDATEIYARGKENYTKEKEQYQKEKLEREKLNLLLSL
jgi:HK97 family phage prohead protease|nr:MAG TPA: prohead serine protease [Caudoviricetes sp.]